MPGSSRRPGLGRFDPETVGALDGSAEWRTGKLILAGVIAVTNVIGAVVVVVIAEFVVALPDVPHPGHLDILNVVVAAAYVAASVPLGTLVGVRALFSLREWLAEGRAATPREQRLVLRAPLRLFLVQLALWLAAAVLFGVLNGVQHAGLGVPVALTVAITGATTASMAYLLTERILRPLAARALAGEAPRRLAVPGVATRAVLAWTLGSGLPVLGIGLTGVYVLAGAHPTRTQLALTMVALAGVVATVGLAAVTLAARATAAPIDSVRRATEQIRAGDYDVTVAVYDGTQIGQLQQGFNRMAAGLAERERIREVFGTYVDPAVAEVLLEQGADPAGGEVEVSVMFVDVRDFTGFSERTPAPEVVAALNTLFGAIVPVISEHGGTVDKFIGDGLLAVFGAPRPLDDHAAAAVAAALAIAGLVRSGRAGDLRVGVGVNSGVVVAGSLGAPGRREFSVIGDTVNVAARIEAATRTTGDDVLVSARTVELLGDRGADLVERDPVELKGRTGAVILYAPAGEPGPASG